MILVYNEIVLEKMNSYEQLENGKLINDCIYPMGEVIEIEAPDHVVPIKYSYNEPKGFYINEEWKNSKESIAQSAKDDLLLELIEGGLI